jgi:hypothetical protein
VPNLLVAELVIFFLGPLPVKGTDDDDIDAPLRPGQPRANEAQPPAGAPEAEGDALPEALVLPIISAAPGEASRADLSGGGNAGPSDMAPAAHPAAEARSRGTILLPMV